MLQRKSDRKKVLFTGGHGQSTAFAIIQEIRNRNKNWDLCFLGARNALEGKSIPTLEVEVFPKMGVKFYSVFTGRVQRKFTRWTVPSLIKIPFGFLHALKILINIRPDIILSFGGFSAFPVVVVGWLLRIPVVIHEQTGEVGRANRYSSSFSTKIAISRESSKKYFKGKETIVTGNPVSKGILKLKAKEKMSTPPNILITGGQTGSVAINDMVEKILSDLLGDYEIMHQVGRYQYKKFLKTRRNLPSKMRENYFVYPVISPDVWYKYMEKADIVVSRSGANAVSETLIAKRPSILIPLPIAYLNEQKKNALYAQKFGIAKVFDQATLTPRKLLKEINDTRKNWYKIVNKVKDKKSPDIEASKKLVDILEAISKPRQ